VIFNASKRSIACIAFAFFLLLQSNTFAQEKPGRQTHAQMCISWLVDGMQFIHTANALSGNGSLDAPEEAQFPLPLVLTNLGLGQWIPAPWREATQIISNRQLIATFGQSASAALLDNEITLLPHGSTILTLGEGESGFLPFAVQSGLSPMAIDTAYADGSTTNPERLAAFYSVTSGQDATDLSNFEDGSQQMVVSHRLLSHLSRPARVETIRESFRVLVEGGTARHSILIPNVGAVLGNESALLTEHKELLGNAVKSLVGEALNGQAFGLSVFLDEVQMRVKGSTTVPLEQLVDVETSRVTSIKALKAGSKGAESRALNLLIVVRKPVSSGWSWESWFGR
jgi:hypothetical protein